MKDKNDLDIKQVVGTLKSRQTYLLAISGGVDSVVLLNILASNSPPDVRLVVAHLDHGIRDNSAQTAEFVRHLAQGYNLEFVSRRLKLGTRASEDMARQARYAFLKEVSKQVEATAIVCAHHQDDFLETVFLNFIRGCHRRGLVSLQSREDLLRPLLPFSKSSIIQYAQQQRLKWEEDCTNYDLHHLRNRIRHRVLSDLPDDRRQALLAATRHLSTINQELDSLLQRYLTYKSYRRAGRVFPRAWFNTLDPLTSCEIVATWLAAAQISTSQKQIRYIVDKLQTLPPGKIVVVSPRHHFYLTKRSIRLNL